MARSVNQAEHTSKRNEILDVAQRLIFARGYEQVTIQDILSELQISKGAFYHYFGSKQALLEALIQRTISAAEEILNRIAAEPGLNTLSKLQLAFDTLGRWKTDQREYLLTMLRAWQADDNARMRQKVEAASIRHTKAWFATMIAQGVAEGVLRTAAPEEAGGVIMALLHGLGERLTELLLSHEPAELRLAHVERAIDAYNHAIEQVLGAPPGSLHLADMATLRAWFGAHGPGDAAHPPAGGARADGPAPIGGAQALAG